MVRSFDDLYVLSEPKGPLSYFIPSREFDSEASRDAYCYDVVDALAHNEGVRDAFASGYHLDIATNDLNLLEGLADSAYSRSLEAYDQQHVRLEDTGFETLGAEAIRTATTFGGAATGIWASSYVAPGIFAWASERMQDTHYLVGLAGVAVGVAVVALPTIALTAVGMRSGNEFSEKYLKAVTPLASLASTYNAIWKDLQTPETSLSEQLITPRLD